MTARLTPERRAEPPRCKQCGECCMHCDEDASDAAEARIAELEAALKKIEDGQKCDGFPDLSTKPQCDACDNDVRIARAALERK